jgi:rSAM/selenodomain-associated transferase 1
MKYQFPDATIQVFCKAPVAGKVKTRLMPELTADQAAKVHRQLTYQTLELVTSSKLCPVQLWCTPDIDHPFFVEMAATFPLTLHLQLPGDLGERMHHALQSNNGENRQTLLMGCDCVSLTKNDLSQALNALIANNDIVLAPAEDGGYCLIGVSNVRIKKEVFEDITWGTSIVLEQTRHKINTLGLRCLELNTQWDVDFYTDYLRFIKNTKLSHI